MTNRPATRDTDGPTVSLDAAARLLGVARSHLWARVVEGELPTVDVRGHTRLCVTTIQSLAGQLGAESAETSHSDQDGGGQATGDRPGWDDYFLGIAEATSARADCHRRRVGAVLVDESRRVIGTGYNGAPSGVTGCLSGGCPRGKLSYDEVAGLADYDSGPGRCVALHAEVNAILYAIRSTRGATMYINHEPCGPCLRTMAGAGIVRSVWPQGECHPLDEHVARTGSGAR